MLTTEYNPIIVAILGALTVFLTLYAVFTPVIIRKTDAVKEEFFKDSASDLVEDSLGKYAKPLLNNFLPQLPTMSMSETDKNKVAEMLLESGNPWKLNPEEYSSMKLIFGSIGFFIGLFLGVLELIPSVPPYLVIMMFTLGLGVLPYSIHNTKRENRSKAAQKGLPEALDLLVVTLTSGQPFEPALNQVVNQLPPGLIKDELSKINLKIKAGTSLERALEAFSREIKSEEIESFAKAIIQAQKLGADVTETLTQQASFVRENHEARVETMIAKLSSLMFIPLAATMLPAFLIIFIAPSISQLTSML